jgi:hypothetical protein
MSETVCANVITASPAEIAELSNASAKVVRAMLGLRAQYGLTWDEALIFMALGQTAICPSSTGARIKAVSAGDISDLLCILRETVRRKIMIMIDKKLASRTVRGFVLQNVVEWVRVASLLRNAAVSGPNNCQR